MKIIKEAIDLVANNDFYSSRKLLINYIKGNRNQLNSDAYHLLSLIYFKKNKRKIAVKLIECAIEFNNNWLYHYNLAVNLLKIDIEKSIKHLNEASILNVNNGTIIAALIKAYLIKGEINKVYDLYEKNKKYLIVDRNLKVLISEIKIKEKKYNEALDILFEILSGEDYDSHILILTIKIIFKTKSIDKEKNKIICEVIQKQIENKNISNEIILNYGNYFMFINEYKKARDVFLLLDESKEGSTESTVLNNIAVSYINEGEKSIAKKYFIKAIEADKNNSMPIINMLHNYNGLEDNYLYSLVNNIIENKKFADENVLMGYIYYYKSKIFDYNNISELKELIVNNINNGKYTEPYILLGMIDDLEVVYENINLYSRKLDNINNKKINKSKNKIGFISADIKYHAVYYMVKDFLKLLKNFKFEIVCLTLNEVPKDIEEQFDKSGIQTTYVGDKNEVELSKYINNNEFSIVFDLGGFTGKNKPHLFNLINNTIVINYLGYLATCGEKFHDYIISDNFLIPEHCRKYYGENILYLDKYYWIEKKKSNFIYKKRINNDSPISMICMNSEFKYNEDILNVWAFLLQFNCKLSLCIEGNNAIKNIVKFFQSKNISLDKIEILPKVDYNRHILRLNDFDIALDTFPSTSGTVAIDCLTNYLPIVTICGSTMSARICSSILNKIELNELICNDYDDYKRNILKLFDINYLNEIKIKILNNINKLYFNKEEEINLDKILKIL